MLAVCLAARQLTRRSNHIHQIASQSFLVIRRVESTKTAIYPHFVTKSRRNYTTSTMASVGSITQSLAAMSIKPSACVSHGDTSSPATWRDALKGAPSSPESFELIKTIVFKPKTAKTATPVPVVVIARDETQTNSGALGTKLNLKDLRLASEDLLKEFFSLDKDSSMCSSTIIQTYN
jgi:hypothetical protein